MKLYLTIFCGVEEIPLHFYSTDRGISLHHFTPLYQTLALIIRANVFPTQHGNKVMTFVELKLMYKLASDRIDFNLAYMIILKMISATKSGYMPYGMLLTQVFEYFKLDTSQLPHFHVKATISDQNTRAPIPLEPHTASNNAMVDLVKLESSVKALSDKHESLVLEFNNLKIMYQTLSLKYDQLCTKVDMLVSSITTAVGRANVIEDGLAHIMSMQFAMSNGFNTSPAHVVPSSVIIVPAPVNASEPAGKDDTTMNDDNSVINNAAYETVD